jgi:hypothetical protein
MIKFCFESGVLSQDKDSQFQTFVSVHIAVRQKCYAELQFLAGYREDEAYSHVLSAKSIINGMSVEPAPPNQIG